MGAPHRTLRSGPPNGASDRSLRVEPPIEVSDWGLRARPPIRASCSGAPAPPRTSRRCRRPREPGVAPPPGTLYAWVREIRKRIDVAGNPRPGIGGRVRARRPAPTRALRSRNPSGPRGETGRPGAPVWKRGKGTEGGKRRPAEVESTGRRAKEPTLAEARVSLERAEDRAAATVFGVTRLAELAPEDRSDLVSVEDAIAPCPALRADSPIDSRRPLEPAKPVALQLLDPLEQSPAPSVDRSLAVHLRDPAADDAGPHHRSGRRPRTPTATA